MLISMLCVWLAMAPTGSDYGQAVADLQRAVDQGASGEVEAGEAIAALGRALDELERYPDELPSDAQTQELLAMARISIVWLNLLEGDEQAAAAAMDEAIRGAQGRALPSGKFGPKVQLLFEQRQEALSGAGTASIEVDCGNVECQLVVDEQRAPNPTAPLLLGTHRVWIDSRDGAAPPEYHELELRSAGATEQLTYVAGAAYTPPQDDVAPPPVEAAPPPPKRMLPRWLEVTGLVAGVGVAVAGGVLLSFDGECENGANPDSEAVCPTVYKTDILSYALMASGGGVALLSGILLSVDEVRVGRAKGRQATLTWTLRF